MTEPSFEEQVDEWIARCKTMIGDEIMEIGSIPGQEPPYQSFIADEKLIKDATGSLGDDNPLFSDPEYAMKSRYGCLIAPPTILIRVRYTVGHGPLDKMYPLANYFSGTLFEWYDVIPVGTRFWTSLRNRQVVDKKGRKGRLLFLVSEGFYWNQRGDLLGKARGHIIYIPMRARFDVERVGEEMIYDRPIYRYNETEIKKIKEDLDKEERRGAQPRYWEDVNVGDVLSPVVMGPFSCQDQIGFNAIWGAISYATFERQYKLMRNTNRTYVHPIFRWPWSAEAEHEDPLLCRYRGLPGPFDYGAHRVAKPSQLLLNWAGDDSFLRKLYVEVRKPKYYGDTTWLSGEVIDKYTVTEKGEVGVGGVPGEAEYAAIDIQIKGINQIDESTTPGRATLYLPSRELGPVQLPIPHLARPPGSYQETTPEYIPFPSYSKEKEIRVARRGY